MKILDVETKKQVALLSKVKILDGVNKGKTCVLLGYSQGLSSILLKVDVKGKGFRVYSPSLLGLEVIK